MSFLTHSVKESAIPFKRETDCRGAKAPRNDEGGENGCAKAFVIYNSALRITNSALFYNNGFKKTNSREKFAAVFESCGYSFVLSADS